MSEENKENEIGFICKNLGNVTRGGVEDGGGGITKLLISDFVVSV